MTCSSVGGRPQSQPHTLATEALQTSLADPLYQTGFANTPFFHGVRAYVKGDTFVDTLHLHFEAAGPER